MVKPDKLDAGTIVKGLDYFDVPGSATRDYKLQFYAHKEGTSLFKVVFINEVTHEYVFYEVSLRATKPGVFGVIELSTPARQSVQGSIKVHNPLNNAANFTVSCNVPEVLMPPNMPCPPNTTVRDSYSTLTTHSLTSNICLDCREPSTLSTSH